MVRVRIEVHLRPGVADPEGANTLKALNLLGFPEAKQVQSAKIFDVDLEVRDHRKAVDIAERMCRRLLANPVIQDYRISVADGVPAAPRPKGKSALRRNGKGTF